MASEPSPPGPPATNNLAWYWVLLIIALFAILCGIGQRVIPLDYGPDEHDHLAYIHHVATTGRLYTPWELQGTLIRHHPPAYYVTMALLWRLAGVEQDPKSIYPGLHAMEAMTPRAVLGRRLVRAATTLISCVTLFLIWRLTCAMGLPAGVQAGLLLLAAGWPNLQYISCVTNNEALTVMWSAIVCLAIVRRLRAGDCSWLEAALIGGLVGGGMWVKRTTLFLVPLGFWAIWSTTPRPLRLSRLGVFVTTMLAIGIWWPLRHYLTVHEWFPGFLPGEPGPPPQDAVAIFLGNPMTLPRWLHGIILTAYTPDWSFAYFPEQAAGIASYGAALLLLLALIIGWRRRELLWAWRTRAMSVVAALLLAAGVLMFCYTTDWKGYWGGGRYLLSLVPWMIAALGAFAASRPARTGTDPLATPAAVLVGVLWLGTLCWWYLTYLFYVTTVWSKLNLPW